MSAARPGLRRSSPRARRALLGVLALAGTLALAAGLTALALGAGAALSIGSASNTTLGEQVLVNSKGRTLYALTPETAGHLLCKSQCLSVWPPLSVSSRSVKLKDGAGVHGRLGVLRRRAGVWQVTLAGRPLYRFSGDRARGEASGEGISSFGGIWHAVTASPPPATTTMPSAPATPPGTTAPSTPTYPHTPGY